MNKIVNTLLALILFLVVGLIFVPSALAATFSLSPSTATKNVGTTFNVNIVLDTKGDAVTGATAILTYDTAKLEVVDSDTTQTGIQIKPGTIFNQAPLTNTVNTSTGQIRYDSGSLGSTYTGSGTMATITFKTLLAGTAKVDYTFTSGSTTNTSLVAASSPAGTNLLTGVTGGTYTISASVGGGGATPAPLPESGVSFPTILVFGAGILALIIGLIFGFRVITF